MQDNQRQTQWAYIAGILDADGCFMITRHNRPTPKVRKWTTVESYAPTHLPSVRIAMCEIEAISLVHDEMGYGFRQLIGARPSRPNSRPIYHWNLQGRKKIIPFLEQVIPFLRVKKNRAEFLLEFAKRKKVTTDGYHGVPKAELEYREWAYQEMRRLNAKVAATTKSQGRESASDSLDS